MLKFPSRYLLLLTIATPLFLCFPSSPSNPRPLKLNSKLHSQISIDTTQQLLEGLTNALSTFQSSFFSLSTGTYPTGIDWTSAVLATILAGTTNSLFHLSQDEAGALGEKYFSHLVAFFYGQDVESVKGQAYDDILWVSLNWIEAIRVIDSLPNQSLGRWLQEWRTPFADRAKEFYGLAEKGWDEVLCGGGMIWSPWLLPYKNAVTNELFIAASTSMFLFHPSEGAARNETYLLNALKGWEWLENSNMKNAAGLYTDGYHIGGLETGETVCNVRDEMVYTYNQGVILTGLRGLAEATGSVVYLQEGWELVTSVLESEGKVGEVVKGGILTEACDVSGGCSQDGQMFKGIFFHHLTYFCRPLHSSTSSSAPPYLHGLPPISDSAVIEHAAHCARFRTFILDNAAAALSTRNSTGVMGSWWGAPKDSDVAEVREMKMSPAAVDYRNVYFPGEEETWGLEGVCVKVCANDVAVKDGDLNDRGRGRTVESHAGGMAAVRAAWEIGKG